MTNKMKELVWNQFGASIDMLINVVDKCPDNYFIRDRRFYYLAFHSAIFLDYYATIPPINFSPLLPFTPKELKDKPKEAIDNLLPDKDYSRKEIIKYLKQSREKCKQIVYGLNEENANDRFKEGEEENDMDYPILEIVLYNLRHTQHHTAQLNQLLRQNLNIHVEWSFRADDLNLLL